MKKAATFTTYRFEPWPGLPQEVEITVWFDEFEKNYRAEHFDLGMGHPFKTARKAADDLAHRHGYAPPFREEES